MSFVDGPYIAFDDPTMEPSPTWTRLADLDGVRVTGWTVDRGKASEFDKTQTGTGTITLADLDGTLDPTNTAGPLFGKLNPLKQAQITLGDPTNDTVETIFRGYVSDWPSWEPHPTGRWMTLTIELMDAFGLFANLEMIPGRHGATPVTPNFADVYFQGTPSNLPDEPDVEKHVDVRINDLLDAALWSALLRDIFSGNVTVQGKVYERRDALLSALQDAVDAEFPGVSNHYMSKRGYYTFRGRFARFFAENPGYGISFWPCGGHEQADADPAVALISDFSFRRSDSDVINACISLPLGVEDADVPDAIVEDATSIDDNGYRSISYDSLLVSAGHDDDGNPTTAIEECAKYSDYTVGNYKDPKTRIPRLTFPPRGVNDPSGPANWGLMIGVEINDVIQLETTHDGRPGFDEELFVEGIHYEASPSLMVDDGLAVANVTLSLDVSPRAFYAHNPFGEVDPEAPPASGALYAAVGGLVTTSDLYTVDPVTAAVTSVGPIGFAVTGLAFDPTTGDLYGATSVDSSASPQALISIDPDTGAGTLIGTFGFVIPDIAFDSTGQLWGWHKASACLTKINKATAAHVDLGNSGKGGGFGCGTSFDGADLPWQVRGGHGVLYYFDTVTGVGSFGPSIDFSALAGLPVTTNGNLTSASFDADGLLWAIHNASLSGLVTIDTVTGVALSIGYLTPHDGNWDALAWRPA